MQLIDLPDFVRRYYSGEEFVLFDTETTGLNTFHDDILEIGASVWSKDGLKDSFQELIQISPNRISLEAWQVHKIPLEEIAKARLPKAVLEDFVSFCQNRTLLAHNIRFDFPMLNSNLIRHGMRPYQNDQVACSLAFAKDRLKPGKLSELAQHYGIESKKGELHRALYDVELLAKVMGRMMKENEPEQMQYSLIL